MKLPVLIPAAFVALAIAGCGSSDSGDPVSDNSGGSTGGTDGGSTGGTDGGSTGGTDGGNSGGTGSASFFNDQTTFSFAESIGGKLSRLFAVGTGAITGGDQAAKRTIQATQTTSQACPGGGSIDLNQTIDDATSELTGIGVQFNSCVDGSETSNGGISISGSALTGTSDTGTVSININNFSVTGADPVAMNGQINASTTIAGDQTTASVNGSGVTMTADGETITFSNYTVTAITNDTTGGSSLSASLSLISSVDGTISLSISPALTTPNDATEYPTTGTIVMTHSDGSSLTINADTGNPATFSYTVNENGVTSSGTANWADTDLDFS